MIVGLSGCNIDIKDKTVIKYADNYPKDRLIKQAQKQHAFYLDKQTSQIKTPAVLRIASDHFEMGRVDGQNFIEYIYHNGPEEFTKRLISILRFISGNIGQFKQVPREKFEIKIEEIEQSLGQRLNIDIPNNIWMPDGYCHGDLTLSNMLFTKEHTYLIDFLDSFIDSPLIDIVKLRQDTYFHHSLSLYQFDDKETVIKALKVCDTYICNAMSMYPWYNNNYIFIQQVNLARILPYANPNLKDRILEHINNYRCWSV